MLQTLTQKLAGLSYYAKLALALSAYQAIFIACLEAFVFSKHVDIVSMLTPNANATQYADDSEEAYANARSVSVYHVLFIVAQFFQLGIYIDAIYNQNTIQIIALMLFEFGILIYSVIQVYQSVQILKTVTEQINILPYEITIIVLIFILAIGFAYLAYKLYQEFGWSIYKRIGADMAMRDRYKMYQIFIMLLKFDLFFFVGLSVQILVLVIFIAKGQADQSQQIAEHIIMSSVISTSMLMAAFLGVKKENKLLMYLFMVGCVGTEVYFMIKLVDISTHPQKYLGTRIFATFFVCICMILDALTLIISALCLRNFDKGLKYHLSRDCNNENETGDQFPPGNNGFNLESVRGTIKRWSID